MSEADDGALSLVRGDALLRIQRAIGLVPKEGLGVGRRAIALALFTWAPIAISALLQQRAFEGTVEEPLLHHFGIHVRCLVALPLLVLAEPVSHGVTTRLLPQFLTAGLVADAERDRFRAVLKGVAKLRDATLPWVVVLALLLGVTLVTPSPAANHELVWAGESTGSFGFGAFWFNWVMRPIFTVLLLAWLWRLPVVFLLCARLPKLDLDLVPTHPDRAGGARSSRSSSPLRSRSSRCWRSRFRSRICCSDC